MGKLGLALLLILALVAAAAAPASATADDPGMVAAWFAKHGGHAKDKTTHLRFYLHDTLSGKNPSAIRIAKSPMTDKSPTLFGAVNMMDDPLTEGPEPNSTVVGRAQGFYGSAGQESLGLLMNMNLLFTVPKFNGSSLSILGRNPVFETFREMPVISGTGVFRLASGIATIKTHYFNITTGDAVVEYNVIVMHY